MSFVLNVCEIQEKCMHNLEVVGKIHRYFQPINPTHLNQIKFDQMPYEVTPKVKSKIVGLCVILMVTIEGL